MVPDLDYNDMMLVSNHISRILLYRYKIPNSFVLTNTRQMVVVEMDTHYVNRNKLISSKPFYEKFTTIPYNRIIKRYDGTTYTKYTRVAIEWELIEE